jgi:hypothetical protein
MNTFQNFRKLKAESNDYNSGTPYSAKVVKENGKHVAKFYKNGEHMVDADYEGQNEKDAHEFASDEMDHRAREHFKNKQVSERIDMPQGHKETADPISDDAVDNRGRVKKMMGNRIPMEIIAKILAGKV